MPNCSAVLGTVKQWWGGRAAVAGTLGLGREEREHLGLGSGFWC